MSNSDQTREPCCTDTRIIPGYKHRMKGKVKENAGQLTNNPGLEAEGTVEKAAGKVQGIIGQVEKALEK